MARFVVVNKEGLEYYHKTQVEKKLDGDVAPITIDRVLTASGLSFQSDNLKDKSYIDVYLYSVVPENCRLVRVLPNSNIGFEISDGVNNIIGYFNFNDVTGTLECTISALTDSTASWSILSAYYYK